MKKAILRDARITDFLRLMFLRQDKEVSENLKHSSFVYFLLEIWKIITFNMPIRKVILVNNQIAGIINLTKPKNHSSEIGYFVGKDYQGRGIATESIKQIVQFGFSKLKLNKIYAYCAPKNIASQKVLLKNGFIKKKSLKNGKFYFEKSIKR